MQALERRDMHADSMGFSAAEALLYLCVSRCGRGRLSKMLVGLTVVAGVLVGIVRLVAG